MRRRFLLSALAVASFAQAAAQAPIPVTLTIDTRRETHAISPFIYGSNGQSDDRDERIAAVRSGGNRLTGYNWENNASNAGEDYINHSDNYLTRFLPPAVQDEPGITLTSFHDSARALRAYSLVTLPAAGYVARDKKGTVDVAETAPSPRWVEVRATKGAPFSLTPDTTDAAVYVDEQVHFLVTRLGNAAGGGIRGYAIDNEPALWPSTHPRIHPQKTTVAEVVERSIATARAVRAVDPSAEVFGAVAYGFSEYRTMQDAPDWESYRSHGTYIDAYLAAMRQAELEHGRRLVDVLDLHWYPEARGTANDGASVRITLEENADPGVANARMQAPRTLWDSTYREESWIGQWFSPVALVPAMKASIARSYPGTKLAFTEINYGGSGHVSGGIAIADVLGIFADHDVYMSNHWGPIEGFTSAAYRLYRNYDGAGGSFGDVSVHSATSDREASAVHASVVADARAGEPAGTLHVVAINRSMTALLDAVFAIDGDRTYARADVWGFDASSPQIRRIATDLPVNGRELRLAIPAVTALHVVLEPSSTSAVPPGRNTPLSIARLAPNPAREILAVTLGETVEGRARIEVIDLMGRVRFAGEHDGGRTFLVPLHDLESGVYQVMVRSGADVTLGRFVVE